MHNKLGYDFYSRDTVVVALELIGKVIVIPGSRRIKARIVETEAYYGSDDPASHAYSGITKRNAVMFGRAGYSYIYFVYGNHNCLNFVTEYEGTPGAVLIRAVEPLAGIDIVRRRRKVKSDFQLTNGPGKTAQALGLTIKQSGLSLVNLSSIYVEEDESFTGFTISSSPRIGISKGKSLLYRFFLNDNKFVSKFRQTN